MSGAIKSVMDVNDGLFAALENELADEQVNTSDLQTELGYNYEENDGIYNQIRTYTNTYD